MIEYETFLVINFNFKSLNLIKNNEFKDFYKIIKHQLFLKFCKSSYL